MPDAVADNRVHGNSTAAQIQKLVTQLDREAQKVLPKQAKMMMPKQDKRSAKRDFS